MCALCDDDGWKNMLAQRRRHKHASAPPSKNPHRWGYIQIFESSPICVGFDACIRALPNKDPQRWGWIQILEPTPICVGFNACIMRSACRFWMHKIVFLTIRHSMTWSFTFCSSIKIVFLTIRHSMTWSFTHCSSMTPRSASQFIQRWQGLMTLKTSSGPQKRPA